MSTWSCFTVTLCIQKEAEDMSAGCSDRQVTLGRNKRAQHFIFWRSLGRMLLTHWKQHGLRWREPDCLFIIFLSSEILFSLYCHARLHSRWCIGLSCCPVSYLAIVSSTLSFKRETCHSLKETIKCCWFPLWDHCTLVASEDFFGICLCYEALNPGWDQFFWGFLLLQRNCFR